jgi:hypothetical protein
VAVMATSRKLVVIAYELLSRGEPYRYAQPAPTAEKLRRLRLRTAPHHRLPGSRSRRPSWLTARARSATCGY